MIDLNNFDAAGDFLEREGYSVSRGDAGSGLQAPTLTLELLDDEDSQQWTLQMVMINQLEPEIELKAESPLIDDEEVSLLQFTVLAPVLVDQDAYVECMRSAFLLNAITPIGGIGMIEAQRRFYFDYKLALPEPSISELVLREVVNMLAFCAEAYGEPLVEVASGRLTTEQLLTQLQQGGNLGAELNS